MIINLIVLFVAIAQSAVRSVVQPFDCDTYDGPLQILEPDMSKVMSGTTKGVVELRYLKLGKFTEDRQASEFTRSNGYELIYRVPDNDCDAVNGCGIHPRDKVIYCHCSGTGGGVTGASKGYRRPHTIMRFDENTIEKVMEVSVHSWSADFAPDGTFYSITEDGKVFRYSGLNTATPTQTYLHTVPVCPFDIVIIKADMIGDGVERPYAVGMQGKRRIYYTALEEGCYGGKCQYLVYANAGPGNQGPEGAVYGGAYKFGGKLYFSDNGGVGMYRLDGAEYGQNVKMWYTTGSAKTQKNDGLYCPDKDWPPLPGLDCKLYNAPMQLLGDHGVFEVAMLRFGQDEDNYFETLWHLPEHTCDIVNACGVHPEDDVIYCHCHNQYLNRIIRFNEYYVEYVMEVKEVAYAATFDEVDGNFYYISKSDKMYKVEDIAGKSGNAPVETFMYDVGDLYLPMDIVTGEFDLRGDGNPKRYAVGIRRDNEVHIFPLAEDCYGMEGCYEMQIATGDKVPPKSVFGAAFAYEKHLFFSDNAGVGGIYEVYFKDGQASLKVISSNSAAHKNDGLFCYHVESPIGPLLYRPLEPSTTEKAEKDVGSGSQEDSVGRLPPFNFKEDSVGMLEPPVRESYKVQLGYDTVVYGLALIGIFSTAYFATLQCQKIKLQVQFHETEQSEL